MLTPVGQLVIASVSTTALSDLSESDALQAGYASLEALLAELKEREGGSVYRVEFGELRADPRIALREERVLTQEQRRELLDKLHRLDARSPDGPWTLRVLELIRSHPGVRAAKLSALAGHDKERFKVNVRKLKNLGLTESLEVGYRVSPRGLVLLRAVNSQAPAEDS